MGKPKIDQEIQHPLLECASFILHHMVGDRLKTGEGEEEDKL